MAIILWIYFFYLAICVVKTCLPLLLLKRERLTALTLSDWQQCIDSNLSDRQQSVRFCHPRQLHWKPVVDCSSVHAARNQTFLKFSCDQCWESHF